MDDDALRQAARHRLDLLDAMVRAHGDLSGLIALVMNSADSATAQTALAQHFGISPEHAVALLDMSVRRMSQHERAKILEERDALVHSLEK